MALIPAYAQDTSDKSAQPKATQVERVTVTGSRVRRIDVEGPTPVQTITSEQITRAGYSSVQEVFDNLSAAVGGSLGQNQTFGFTPGASGVDLRGFGVDRTLVLLDGRRLPAYPIASGGTDNFVDLSSIPLEIIDRIEILKSGGSAIYGSDAISGVINFVTKKKYSGFSFTARAGGTEHGGYGNERGQLSYGFKNDTDSFVFGAEYAHNDALEATDRAYSQSDVIPGRTNIIQNYSIYGSTFLDFDNGVLSPSSNCGTSLLPGTVPGLINPTLAGAGFTGTVCGFDRSKFRQLYPSIDRTSVFAHFEHNFGFATAYVQGLYTNQATDSKVEPFPYYSPFIPAGASNNPSPAGGGGYFYRRAIEFGARGANIVNITRGLLAGLKGTFGDYQWDVGFARNQAGSDQRNNSILKSALDDAVCGGGVSGGACTYSTGPGLNLLNPIPADVIANSSYLRTAHAISQNSTFDAQINGPLGIKLPAGGEVQFSAYLGGELDQYSDLVDPITASGRGIDGAVSAVGNRRYAAAAGEIDLPFLKDQWGAKELSVNIAGRYDRYFDKTKLTGEFSPQINLLYRPINEVLFRASGSHTFRAPDLQRVFGGTTSGFESAIDTPLCVAQGGTPGPSSPIAACNTPVQSIPTSTGGNPDLKPEKGRNYSFGLVLEPVKDLSLSVDYFYIQLNEIVVSPTAQFILNQCATTGSLCDLITRSPAGTLQATGGALIVENPLNAASQVERGLDYEVKYGYTYAPIGHLALTFNMTYLASLSRQNNNESPNQQQINVGTSVLVPRYRYNVSLGWDRGPAGFTIGLHAVDRVPGANNIDDPAKKANYLGSYHRVDTQLSYDFKSYGLIRVGINNVFNQDPPTDPTDDNNQFTSGAALAYADPFGREGYVQYELHYK